MGHDWDGYVEFLSAYREPPAWPIGLRDVIRRRRRCNARLASGYECGRLARFERHTPLTGRHPRCRRHAGPTVHLSLRL